MNKQYKELVGRILENGYDKYDYGRSTNTKTIPYHTITHNMGDSFPLLTIKEMDLGKIASELTWFIRGSTDIRYLWEYNNNIWNKDYWNFLKKKYGDALPKMGVNSIKDVKMKTDDISKLFGEDFFSLGRIYGHQWRKGKDALESRLWWFMNNPNDRGHVLNAWCEDDMDEMALRPCHTGFKLVTNTKDGREFFDLVWYQRSVDVGLGLPYNIASYALLGKLIEKISGRRFNDLVGMLTDVHIYEPHIPKMMELLDRDENKYILPELRVESYFDFCRRDEFKKMLDNITPDIFKLVNYDSYPPLKMDMLALD